MYHIDGMAVGSITTVNSLLISPEILETPPARILTSLQLVIEIGSLGTVGQAALLMVLALVTKSLSEKL
jgi:hypothetical protein